MCCRGVVHAYISIWRGEGLVAGLYRGTAANIARNAIVNVGETVVYDAVKGGEARCGEWSLVIISAV